MLGAAKGAVRWSAHAILSRSGVAGASSFRKPVPRPAASLALYTASCKANVISDFLKLAWPTRLTTQKLGLRKSYLVTGVQRTQLSCHEPPWSST